MKNTRQTELGEIDSINGNILSIKIFDNIKSSMPIINGIVYRTGQIGSFLKIPLGFCNLYALVTQVGSAAIPDKLKELYIDNYGNAQNTRWLNAVLVGEQVGNRFERGVTQFPTTGDKVHLVTLSDLDIIYGGYNDHSAITIGNISASESLSAKLDLDKLVSRHAAILGSTGSGKSNAVAVFLEAIAKKGFKSSRVLVIDPHGEYSETLKGKSKVFRINAGDGENELYIPFWALPFDELIRIFPGNLTDQNREYIREKIVEYKTKEETLKRLKINRELITADTPVPFSLKELWFELDDFERQTFRESRKPETIENKIKQGDANKLISNEYPPAGMGTSRPFMNNFAKGLLRFLDTIRVKFKDSRYNFLLNPGSWNPDSCGKVDNDLDDLLYKWLGDKAPVTILDLSGVPNEIMSSISGTLLKIVNDSLFWGQNTKVGGKKQPLLIVLEEAHNYLKAGEQSISSRTVQAIAKEGRKYGLGLLLVTQRPSELDETVLSQCGTIIALRMNNSKDRSHVKAAVQDELQSIIDLLPSLRTGEGIISGEAVKIPSRALFYKVSHAPRSIDPKPSIEWLNELPSKDEYEKSLNLWRSQSFKNMEVKK